MFTGNSRGPVGLLAALGVGLGSLSGCGGETEQPAPDELTSAPVESMRNTASDLYVASARLWRPMTVAVCWENPATGNATQRQWVRNAVVRTWEARSGVRFTGWGTCPATSTGIRINISDTGPHVKALGNGLNGMAQGMVLNFTFANWGQSCQSQLQYCIDAIAVHEFGHAMGYAHEQNRPDRPSTCTEPAQGSSGDWLIGPWDLSSVMNYCNPDWNGNGNLSATDVYGAQVTYGVPWESLGGSFNSGPAVASWGVNRLDCSAGAGQPALSPGLGWLGVERVVLAGRRPDVGPGGGELGRQPHRRRRARRGQHGDSPGLERLVMDRVAVAGRCLHLGPRDCVPGRRPARRVRPGQRQRPVDQLVERLVLERLAVARR
ncbi:M12 family metallopeptidase [Pyxidicoccus sp. 3LG]